MNFQFSKTIFLILIVFLTLCSSAVIQAQTAEEIEVSPVKNFGSRYSRCFINEGNAVVDEARFKELNGENCPELKELLMVDFAKHTLITYRIGGDCFMRAKSKVTRKDAEKRFTVKITNFWGGCRAGGSIRGWIVLDKIPSDYKIEFSEEKVDGLKNTRSFEADEDFFFSKKDNLPKNLEILPTREINLDRCVQMWLKDKFVIKTQNEFQAAIRKDASRDHCLKKFENFDFEKNSLLGININSGYCRRPIGLEFQTLKDKTNKKYSLNISYIDPDGAICRALSQFDLWVLVPKIPDGFDVNFDIKPELREQN